MLPITRRRATVAHTLLVAGLGIVTLSGCAPESEPAKTPSASATPTTSGPAVSASTSTGGSSPGASQGTASTPATTPTVDVTTQTSVETPDASTSTTASGQPKAFPVAPGTKLKFGKPATVNFAVAGGHKYRATVTVTKMEKIPNAQLEDKQSKEAGADRYRVYYDVELVENSQGKPVSINPQQLRPAGVANKHKGAFVYASGDQGCPPPAKPLINAGDKATGQCQAYDIAGPEITDVVLNPDGIMNWATWTK